MASIQRRHAMTNFGEHIEEVAKLYREEGLPYNSQDIAIQVADIACAQGLISEGEVDQAVHEIRADVVYILGIEP